MMAKKILVVEDNEVNAKMIKDFLKFKGYDIYHVSNGNEVFAKVMEIMPDLILLDIQIFGISGIEVAKLLKADERCKKVPIFMLSAFSKDNFSEHDMTGLYEEYVEKPIVFSALTLLISDYLEN